MSSVMVLFWCLMKVFCCSTTACMESSLDFAALRSDFVALRSLSAASVSSTHSWASAEGREASSLDRLALGGADAGAARGLLWGLGLPGIGGGGGGGGLGGGLGGGGGGGGGGLGGGGSSGRSGGSGGRLRGDASTAAIEETAGGSFFGGRCGGVATGNMVIAAIVAPFGDCSFSLLP